jgi:hypothetical protein
MGGSLHEISKISPSISLFLAHRTTHSSTYGEVTLERMQDASLGSDLPTWTEAQLLPWRITYPRLMPSQRTIINPVLSWYALLLL